MQLRIKGTISQISRYNTKTDISRFDIVKNSRGYGGHFRRRVDGEDMAARYRAPHEAQ